jgi:hypothetical protein
MNPRGLNSIYDFTLLFSPYLFCSSHALHSKAFATNLLVPNTGLGHCPPTQPPWRSHAYTAHMTDMKRRQDSRVRTKCTGAHSTATGRFEWPQRRAVRFDFSGLQAQRKRQGRTHGPTCAAHIEYLSGYGAGTPASFRTVAPRVRVRVVLSSLLLLRILCILLCAGVWQHGTSALSSRQSISSVTNR